jgi:hypothetical protein
MIRNLKSYIPKYNVTKNFFQNYSNEFVFILVQKIHKSNWRFFEIMQPHACGCDITQGYNFYNNKNNNKN